MKQSIVAALAFLIATGAAQADQQPPPLPFPGLRLFPIAQLGSDDELLHTLYEGRLLVPGARYPTCKPDCTLTPKGRMSWDDDLGNQHVGFVVVAEPDADDAAHADGAYVGMVDLLKTAKGWVINAGSPIVAATGGSFGQAPPIQLVSAGKFGMAVIIKPAFMNQGEIQQNWNLFVQVHPTSEFKQVLSVPVVEDNSGKCEGDQCRSHDFTTDVVVSDEGNSLYVRVTKHPHAGVSTFKDYTITP